MTDLKIESRTARKARETRAQKEFDAVWAKQIDSMGRLRHWPAKPDDPAQELSWSLRKLESEFFHTSNFLCVIEAFCDSMDIGEAPPAWILELIHQRFTHYLDNGGTKKLDAAFGVTRPAGNYSAWTERRDFRRDINLAFAVLRFESIGFSRNQAARALSLVLERLPEGASLKGFPAIGEPLQKLDLGARGIKNAVEKVEDYVDERWQIRAKFRNAWPSPARMREMLKGLELTDLPPSFERKRLRS